MDFRILGPLSVTRDTSAVRLRGRNQQTILAMLLLEHGRVVPIDRLIFAIWADAPPATARDQVQIGVSRLRRALRDAADTAIRTLQPGYLLDPGTDVLDRDLYIETACGTQIPGRGDVEAAVAQMRAALAL